MKELTDKNFIDWFSYNFGYGYGNGEQYIIPALKGFLDSCQSSGNYDYEEIEKSIGKAETWFLMNTLCGENIIEYGTSPRYGWLTEKGRLLKEYLSKNSWEVLYDIVMVDESYIHCSKNYCNCGEKGYEEGKKCDNPLF